MAEAPAADTSRTRRGSTRDVFDSQRCMVTSSGLERHVKDTWLAQRHAEWEELQQRREKLRSEGSNAPLFDDETLATAAKAEWLRRKRLEHEQAMARRQKAAQGDASDQFTPVVDPEQETLATMAKAEWLRRKRLEHEQAAARRQRAAQGDASDQFTPVVNPELLSSHQLSEKEQWLVRRRQRACVLAMGESGLAC